MTNSLLIGKVIKSLLSIDVLKEYINDRIFHIVAENGTLYPFVVYKRSSVQNINFNKDGYVEDLVKYTLTIISTDYIESVEIANIIRGILDKPKITNGDITLFNNRLVSADENYSDNAYIQNLSFECIINN